MFGDMEWAIGFLKMQNRFARSWSTKCKAFWVSTRDNWPGAAVVGRSGCVTGVNVILSMLDNCPTMDQ